VNSFRQSQWSRCFGDSSVCAVEKGKFEKVGSMASYGQFSNNASPFAASQPQTHTLRYQWVIMSLARSIKCKVLRKFFAMIDDYHRLLIDPKIVNRSRTADIINIKRVLWIFTKQYFSSSSTEKDRYESEIVHSAVPSNFRRFYEVSCKHFRASHLIGYACPRSGRNE